ncbi:hypothetical protein IYX23_14815 [Methylocystis sp. L43]|jgi:hypothetical protein|uniref:hypothetical protein n=1 Tax=unclassified Methylocystis TaxID=2625913 RepID=UPI0018C28E69|nr:MULTISPECIES: hypothetical protein [unclassified Methylocystis]MBG0798938.1 hypothetical protein [Methylocystis sp. L43]MBG0806686.1 hypothetical protein [Methylocystis sp. H15]
MKLAQSQRCALYALAGLAAVQAAPALAGDDKSTWSAMMEMVGASSDEGAGKIDYSERPKLVLPPSAGDLPPPRERGARSGEWPAELSAERRRNVNRYARVPNAPPEAPRPGVFARVLSFGSGAEPPAPAVEEPSRVMLTEPPPGYRRPTQDLNNLRETEVAKKSSWWNPLSWGRGGADKPAASASAANPAAPDMRGGGAHATGAYSAAASDTRGGDMLSNFSAVMPQFLRGSSDNDKN